SVTSVAYSTPVQHGTPAFGVLQGSAAVSPRGMAQYTIPLTTPDGVAGLKPDLALAYQSRSGSGLAGAGWTLRAGLQTIHRCRQTVAQDGVASGITNTPADRLCLNGQRLVAISGNYGLSGAEYRTEIASFQRIRSFGATNQAPDSFEVTAQDGTKYTFGFVAGGPDGRIENAGSATIRLWALGRIQDRFSNYIDYRYTEDTNTGEYYLDDIRYTGHLSTPTLAPRFAVKATFEDRPDDVRERYVAGDLVTSSKRLSKVETLFNGSIVRRYYLDYESAQTNGTGRSRLKQVTDCALSPAEKCLSPIIIDWQHGDSGWDPVVTSPGASQGDRFLTGDWDGDGRTDLFVAYETSTGTQEYRAEWKIVLGKDDLAGMPILTGLPAHELETAAPDDLRFKYKIIDFNGDGRSDILRMFTDGSEWEIFQSTGDIANPFEIVVTGIVDSYLLSEPVVVDFDGDGLKDLVSGASNLTGRKNLGGAFGPPQMLASYYEMPDPEPDGYDAPVTVTFERVCCIANFNNDGIPDLRVRVLVEDEVPGYDGDENPDTYTEWRYYWAYLGSTGSGYEVIATFEEENYRQEVVDVNGDGLDDLSYDDSGQGWIEINTGDGFADPILTAPTPSANILEWTKADYNGDGREDRIFLDDTGTLWIMVSNGQGFDTAIIGGSAGENIKVADVDGDGYSDLISGVPGAAGTTPHTIEDPPDPCDQPPPDCQYV
ncbi:MAG: VCBS repeat-containing protein, partial [Gammaproteobacteria bacterium]|nr:VCBS repeat-containing protein [Gammaproteobacteria bacterium]